VSLTVRPATAGDIVSFSSMSAAPTVRAMVAEKDGAIIAMGGLALSGGRWFAFLDLTDDARPYKMTMMRWAIRIMAQSRRDGIRFVYWHADPNEPGALPWLTSLGFTLDPRTQHLYRWSSH
jgi:hypothetical protein